MPVPNSTILGRRPHSTMCSGGYLYSSVKSQKYCLLQSWTNNTYITCSCKFLKLLVGLSHYLLKRLFRKSTTWYLIYYLHSILGFGALRHTCGACDLKPNISTSKGLPTLYITYHTHTCIQLSVATVIRVQWQEHFTNQCKEKRNGSTH